MAGAPAFAEAQIKFTCFHANVYEPAEDSFALVDVLRADAAQLQQLKGPVCLEVGCGTGYVVTSLALLLQGTDATFFATDINNDAVQATRATLSQHGMRGEVILTDIAAALHHRLRHQVDVLVCNPPYVPSLPEEVGGSRLSASWAGGFRGREIIDRMLPQVPQLLSRHGVFYLVLIASNDVAEVMRNMEALGLSAQVALVRNADEERLIIVKATML